MATVTQEFIDRQRDPFVLYQLGSQLLWGAAFEDLPADVLNPAEGVAAQDILQATVNKSAQTCPEIAFSARNHLAHVALCTEWAYGRDTTPEVIDETHIRLAGVLKGLGEEPENTGMLAQFFASTIFQMLLARLRDPFHIAIPAVPTKVITRANDHQRYPNMLLRVSTSDGQLLTYAPRIRTRTRTTRRCWESSDAYRIHLGEDLYEEMLGSPDVRPDGLRQISRVQGIKQVVQLTSSLLVAEALGKHTGGQSAHEAPGGITHEQSQFLDTVSSFYVRKTESIASTRSAGSIENHFYS